MMDETVGSSDILGERLVETVKKAEGKYNTTQLIMVSFTAGLLLGLFIGHFFL
jgi:Na+-transporting NADH:ubiquinone oxidoreductase subunit NqrD